MTFTFKNLIKGSKMNTQQKTDFKVLALGVLLLSIFIALCLDSAVALYL